MTDRYYNDPAYRELILLKAREYHERTYARNRIIALLKYGDKCACCGETEPMFLQFDHVNDDGATDRADYGGSRNLVRALAQEPVRADIQVLCANCNAGKQILGVCPHQVHPWDRGT